MPEADAGAPGSALPLGGGEDPRPTLFGASGGGPKELWLSAESPGPVREEPLEVIVEPGQVESGAAGVAPPRDVLVIGAGGPVLAGPRDGRAGPQLTVSGAGGGGPRRAAPQGEDLAPDRELLRDGSGELRDEWQRAGAAGPGRARLRGGGGLPEQTLSDTKVVGPVRTSVRVGGLLPERARDLIGGAEPGPM